MVQFLAATSTTFTIPLVASGYTSTNLTLAPPQANTYPQWQYATASNTIQLLAGGQSSSTTNAAASGQYFEFTLAKSSGTFAVSSLSFYVFKGAAGVRGWVVRSSADSFAANIGGADSSQTPTVIKLSLTGAAYTNLTSITFRMYGFSDAAATYGSVLFTNIKVY